MFAPKTLKRILLLLLSIVILAILVNLISNELESALKEELGEYYFHSLIGLGIIIFAIYLYFELSGERNSTEQKENWASIRNELLSGTLRRYQNRIKEKLNHDHL